MDKPNPQIVFDIKSPATIVPFSGNPIVTTEYKQTEHGVGFITSDNLSWTLTKDQGKRRYVFLPWEQVKLFYVVVEESKPITDPTAMPQG